MYHLGNHQNVESIQAHDMEVVTQGSRLNTKPHIFRSKS